MEKGTLYFIIFALGIWSILITVEYQSEFSETISSIVDYRPPSRLNLTKIELFLSLDKIPKHIFSTMKDPNSLPLFPCMDTSWIYTEYDNVKMKKFLTMKYSDKINIKESMKFIVEQADLWRYSIIYEYGGLYMDADTNCTQTIGNWLRAFDLDSINVRKNNAYILSNLLHNTTVPFQQIIPQNHTIEIDMVIGIEFPFVNHRTFHNLQFVQWAFLGQPRSKILKSVIDNVLSNLNNTPDRMQNIVDRTGPGAFTTSILEFIGNYSLYDKNLTLFEDLKQTDISGHLIPLMHDGDIIWIMILPYRAFGYSAGHKEHKGGHVSGNKSQILIQHKFGGSWKRPSAHLTHHKGDKPCNCP